MAGDTSLDESAEEFELSTLATCTDLELFLRSVFTSSKKDNSKSLVAALVARISFEPNFEKVLYFDSYCHKNYAFRLSQLRRNCYR